MNSTNIIKLGEKIVNELLLSDGVDTLSKWMAHYISELIEKAKNSSGEEKEKYEKECFETILKVWNEIDKVPNIEKPLKRFDDIQNLVQELSSDKKYRYFQTKHEDIDCVYLRLIKAIDGLSKKIIKKSLILGIERAAIDEKDWLEFDLLQDVNNIITIRSIYQNEDIDNLQIKKEEREDLKKAIKSFSQIIDVLDSKGE